MTYALLTLAALLWLRLIPSYSWNHNGEPMILWAGRRWVKYYGKWERV